MENKREGKAFPQKRCNSETSDYDLGLFPDRIKGRLVVKFKTSSFLSEDSTSGGFAFSQLFCKLITGESDRIPPWRQTALFRCGGGGPWGWVAGFVLGQLPLQEPSFLPLDQAGPARAFWYLCLDLNVKAPRKDSSMWPVAAFLTTPTREGLGLLSWAMETPSHEPGSMFLLYLSGLVQNLEVHSLSFWPYGLHFSTTSFDTGVPFHSALVICLFTLRPTPSFQLCIAEDRPLHTICRLFCQPSSDKVWPVGGTRGDWMEVGWISFLGFHNKVPQIQFWKLAVWHQGVRRATFPPKALG